MHHPVAERRRRDEPALGLVDMEALIRAWPIGSIAKLLGELDQVVGEADLELRGGSVPSFSTGRLSVGPQQVGPVIDSSPQRP
jgi:hypothetical protein